MLPKFITLAVSLLLYAPCVFAAGLAPLPSNRNPDLASTMGAMVFLMRTSDPLHAFETSGSNLRAFLDDPTHDTVAIIDLREDAQYNEGYIKGSLRWPMRDGAQGVYIQQMQSDRIPAVLAKPMVKYSKYVVFYCQAGASRSPEIARGYYEYARRNGQVVVLLANGFEEFARDPSNKDLIGRRATFINPSTISKIGQDDSEEENVMDSDS